MESGMQADSGRVSSGGTTEISWKPKFLSSTPTPCQLGINYIPPLKKKKVLKSSDGIKHLSGNCLLSELFKANSAWGALVHANLSTVNNFPFKNYTFMRILETRFLKCPPISSTTNCKHDGWLLFKPMLSFYPLYGNKQHENVQFLLILLRLSVSVDKQWKWTKRCWLHLHRWPLLFVWKQHLSNPGSSRWAGKGSWQIRTKVM